MPKINWFLSKLFYFVYFFISIHLIHRFDKSLSHFYVPALLNERSLINGSFRVDLFDNLIYIHRLHPLLELSNCLIDDWSMLDHELVKGLVFPLLIFNRLMLNSLTSRVISNGLSLVNYQLY